MNLCALCNGRRVSVFRRKDAKSKGVLNLGLCSGCGLVQQTSIPKQEELLTYYSHNYRKDYKQTYHPKAKHVWRAGNVAMDRLSFLRAHSPYPILGRSLVDVGAGGGEFVYLAKRAGFDAHGLEPNVGYSQFAREAYDVEVTTADISRLPESGTDLVTLFHVLEHLPNPRESIKQIFNALKPNGLLLIEVPNILQKDASPSNIFFKAHIFYFSIGTLQKLTEPYFELVASDDSGNLRALFKRREDEIPATPTDCARVGREIDEFRRNGWFTYLTIGRGALKPFYRIERLIAEITVKDAPPKTLLDSIFDNWANKPSEIHRTIEQRLSLARIGGTGVLGLTVLESLI